jgi:hypothetical protein
MRRFQTRSRTGLAPLVAAVFALGIAGSGCLAGHPLLTAPAAPVFRPEGFFDGPSHGTGAVRIRTRRTQPLRVDSHGAAQPDGSFRLDQTITIGDAAPRTRTRTWTMTRTADGGYVSTLTDARGPVEVTAHGAELRIHYRMGTVTTMDQRIVLRPDGQSALNVATVRMMGVPVARLEEVIERGASSPPLGGGQ